MSFCASSGQASQASPKPSMSVSVWSGFATAGQLSFALQTPSRSVSPPPPSTQTPITQVSGMEQESPLLQSEFCVQLTQSGGLWAKFVKSTGGTVVSQVPVFGPLAQPHQLFSALSEPEMIRLPSAPV